MSVYIDKMLEILDEKINSIESEIDDVIEKAEKGIDITKNTLLTLREQIIKNGFSNVKEEIQFFKNRKPKVYSKLIYYVKLLKIECKRPRSSFKAQQIYFDNEIDKLQIYFNDNLEFYHYFRRNCTCLDKHYFVRGKEDLKSHPDNFHFFIDDEFSTSHDSIVATIMAYDRLIIYLQQEIGKLNNNNNNTLEPIIQPGQLNSSLNWTTSKVDLVELIYALHSSGAVNSGFADIKEIASIYEQIFNIDLGNYYHIFTEIQSRKTNPTKFIDKLKESLTLRLQESDE